MQAEIGKKTGRQLRMLTTLCGALMLALGITAMAGWATGYLLLASWRRGFIPMAPSTALAMIVLGFALILAATRAQSIPARRAVRLCYAAVLVLAITILVHRALDIGPDIEELVLGVAKIVGGFPIGRMSLVTAAGLTVAAVSLLSPESRRTGQVVRALGAVVVFMVGLSVFLGYLYQVPLLYGGPTVPVAVPTSTAFLVLAIAIIVAGKAETWPVAVIFGTSVRGKLLRYFLPTTVLIVILQGYLLSVVHEDAQAPFISAIMVLTSVVVVAGVVYRLATGIGGAIDRTEKELRDKQDQVRESEERYRGLFENANDAIYLIDPQDLRILDCNAKAAEMTGYTVEELRTMAVPDLHPAEELPLLPGRFKSASLAGRIADISGLHHKRPDGTLVPVEINASEINLGGRRVNIGVIRDITEREEAERNVRQLNADLERRVARRTVDLEESRRELIAANERLEELDRLKSVFIASTSHELRTPLNSIIGFSSLLLCDWPAGLSEEQRTDVEIVNQSGKDLLALINDVIDISRVEAGNLDAVTEEFSLAEVASEAIGTVRDDARSRGLQVTFDVTDELVSTDRRRLLQCLNNLLINATKFSEKGSIDLTGKVEAGEVVIRVADTGIGIKKEQLGDLFQPFHRLDSPLRSKTSGTGLGLYMVKKIVEEVLQGSIRVDSTVGKGSVFTIRFPAVAASDAMAA